MAKYLTTNSKFRPYSLDELIKPYQMYGQAYKEQEQQLINLQDKASIWENMIDPNKDAELYSKVQNYTKNLEDQAASLASEGINNYGRQNLLNLRRQYSKDITPIEQAYSRLTDIGKQQQADYRRDPTRTFAKDASQISLSELMQNPNYSSEYFSGDQLQKKGQQMGNTLSKLKESSPEISSMLGGQYFSLTQQKGYTPEEAFSMIAQQSDAPEELMQAANNILSEIPLEKFDNKAQNKAKQSVLDGIVMGMVGDSQTKTMNNRAWRSAQAIEQDEENRALFNERLEYQKQQALYMKAKADNERNPEVLKKKLEYTDSQISKNKAQEKYYNRGRTTPKYSKPKDIKTGNKILDTSLAMVEAKPNVWKIGEVGEDVGFNSFGLFDSNYGSQAVDWGYDFSDSAAKEHNKLSRAEEENLPQSVKLSIAEYLKENKIDARSINIYKVKGSRPGVPNYVIKPNLDRESPIYKKTVETSNTNSDKDINVVNTTFDKNEGL